MITNQQNTQATRALPVAAWGCLAERQGRLPAPGCGVYRSAAAHPARGSAAVSAAEFVAPEKMRAQDGECAAAEGAGRTRHPAPPPFRWLLQVDVQPPLRSSQIPAGEAEKGTPGLMLQRAGGWAGWGCRRGGQGGAAVGPHFRGHAAWAQVGRCTDRARRRQPGCLPGQHVGPMASHALSILRYRTAGPRQQSPAVHATAIVTAIGCLQVMRTCRAPQSRVHASSRATAHTPVRSSFPLQEARQQCAPPPPPRPSAASASAAAAAVVTAPPATAPLAAAGAAEVASCSGGRRGSSSRVLPAWTAVGAAVVCPAAKQQLIVANGATCGGVHTDPPTQGSSCMTHERLGGLTSNFRCHAYVKNCVHAFYGKYSRVVQRGIADWTAIETRQTFEPFELRKLAQRGKARIRASQCAKQAVD